MPKQVSERAIVALIGGIQFINVLEFMIVMPLGPDVAASLGVPASRLGLLGSSYAVAAAISGLLGALFLDRFDRRRALGVALAGLVLGTAAGGLAQGLYSLMAARLLAGMFGGPATSLSLSILTDVVPLERRGRALGAVMSAFSIASVLGVPLGLRLALYGGWRTPFFCIAALGLVIATVSIALMPPMRDHLTPRTSPDGTPEHETGMLEILGRSEVKLALGAVSTAMMASFLMVPNIAAYVQYNCGFPRDRLEQVYAIGGVCTFAANRVVGRLVDRFGSLPVLSVGTTLFSVNLVAGFMFGVSYLPIWLMFVLFMVSGTLRGVPMTTVTTRVPYPSERARYQSLLSAVQHIASAIGAFASSLILYELPDRRLGGMRTLCCVSICFAMLLPVMLRLTVRQLNRRDPEHPHLPANPHLLHH